MEILIGGARESDLHDVDRICRVDFGTFLGIPDPR
jgi:hypothetical protein